ncbi:MAG: glutamyl-tRNA reductase [Candidatus Omnitrophica bacterium]|nr:glutamyl-tRNA reductase [Candidatus Omnitrophota bacterium]
MPFVLVGVNHKTCPLDVREKFFLQPAEKELLLAQLKNDPRVLAAVVLSTCNRTEIYADLLKADPAAIFHVFFNLKQLPIPGDLHKYIYVRYEADVVEHLLRVITGLDSLILGEGQILGQVKEALSISRHRHMLNKEFNILSHMAVETARKVRRETDIDRGGMSIAWAAVSKAQEVGGSLKGKIILLMGSGKMGRLVVQQLQKKGAARIYVMNRTEDKAVELAGQCDGVAVHFWQIREILEEADVCICSAGAPHYLVDGDLMVRVMAQRPERRLLMVDIAVPRNIDPLAAKVPGVSLMTVDDLAETVEGNMNRRVAAAELAAEIVRAKTQEFYKKLDRAAVYEMLGATKI